MVGLVASGLSNQEIAAQLFVTINTVKTNLRNAYRRIGCRTRT
jgi:DNA-binding CsgD family transcriptional regulator